MKKPKAALLLFASGKFVCTGAKNAETIHGTIGIVIAKLKKLDFKVSKEPQIRIENIVATIDLKKEFKFNNLAISLGLERIEYEPEQFPGLVYRGIKPKVVMLLFGSGKIVWAGAKDIKDIEIALNQLIGVSA